MAIRDKLHAMEGFSNSEKALATYILSNRDEILHMSVQELSKRTFTSSSTVVRLCQKMGLTGFADFKIQFAAELQRTHDTGENEGAIAGDANFPIQKDDSIYEISRKIYQLERAGLEDTYRQLSMSEMQDAVSLISQSAKVALFGCGDNHAAGELFQNNMMKIGKTILMPPLPMEHEQLALTLGEGDCAILLSYSGEIRQLFPVVRILMDRKVPYIAVTAKPQSNIGRQATIVLQNNCLEDQQVKFSPFASKVGVEYILNVLYACYFVQEWEGNAKQRIQSEMLLASGRASDKEKDKT